MKHERRTPGAPGHELMPTEIRPMQASEER